MILLLLRGPWLSFGQLADEVEVKSRNNSDNMNTALLLLLDPFNFPQQVVPPKCEGIFDDVKGLPTMVVSHIWNRGRVLSVITNRAEPQVSQEPRALLINGQLKSRHLILPVVLLAR
jgi:hypothetical protein